MSPPFGHSLIIRKLRQYLRCTWMVSVIEARAPGCGGRSEVRGGGGSPRREWVQAAIDSEMDAKLYPPFVKEREGYNEGSWGIEG